jgi:hypothetical protein
MNLKQATQFLTTYLRRLSYGETVRPARDWLLIVAIVGVFIIASVSWSYWVFYRIGTGESAIPGAGATPSVNPVTVQTVTDVFDARAAERAHYLNDYRFVDPSQ